MSEVSLATGFLQACQPSGSKVASDGNRLSGSPVPVFGHNRRMAQGVHEKQSGNVTYRLESL